MFEIVMSCCDGEFIGGGLFISGLIYSLPIKWEVMTCAAVSVQDDSYFRPDTVAVNIFVVSQLSVD